VRSMEDGSRSCQVFRNVLEEGTERSRRNGILGCRLSLSIWRQPGDESERCGGNVPDYIDDFAQYLR